MVAGRSQRRLWRADRPGLDRRGGSRGRGGRPLRSERRWKDHAAAADRRRAVADVGKGRTPAWPYRIPAAEPHGVAPPPDAAFRGQPDARASRRIRAPRDDSRRARPPWGRRPLSTRPVVRRAAARRTRRDPARPPRPRAARRADARHGRGGTQHAHCSGVAVARKRVSHRACDARLRPEVGAGGSGADGIRRKCCGVRVPLGAGHEMSIKRALPVGLVSLAGLILFGWPFIGAGLPANTPAWALAVGCVAGLLLVEAGTRELDSRAVALLAAI